jgi:putative endonuclease
MFYYVYILESKTIKGKLYIGFSSNLKRRLLEHNQGLNKSTIFGKPWQIIYAEACLNKEDAQRRESYLKTNQGARLLKCRLKEYLFLKKREII